MINSALSFIKQQLDHHLALNFALDESAVVVNSLLDLDGGVPKKNKNKVVITMINLDHETSRQYSTVQRRLNSQEVAAVSPAQYFNVDLLFTASFDDYQEALKFLSATIRFFQVNTSFKSDTMPDMPKGISRLNVEIENTNFLDTHNLWSVMGAKYRPSIIYKLRHIIFDSEQINTVQQTFVKS